MSSELIVACRAFSVRRLGLAGLMVAAAGAPCHASADSPLFASTKLAYYLSTPKGKTARDAVPELKIAIGSGDQHLADMDTGSTGVVISATSLPDFNTEPSIKAALKRMGYDFTTDTFPADPDFTGLSSILYSSSGREEYGITLNRRMTISGARTSGSAGSITTQQIPILAVLYTHCVPNARHCTPSDTVPKGIGLIGIGFAREKDHQVDGTPDRNPFLHVASPEPGPLTTRGYIVGNNSVEVGVPLDEALTTGFRFVQLIIDPTYAAKGIKEWQPFTASITLNDGTPVNGNALIDTGIPSMFMSVPYSTAEAVRVPVEKTHDAHLKQETRVAIAIGRVIPPLAYSFITDDTKPATAMMPTNVTLVGNDGTIPDDHATFVNTGFHFLDKVDYLYAYDFGCVGFRPHS